MVSLLLFLPRLFRYFGMFQSFMGFVRPLWPTISRMWKRTPGTAAAAA